MKCDGIACENSLNKKVPYEWVQWITRDNGDNSMYLRCMVQALPQIIDEELTELQKNYIKMRFYEHLTLEEIGDYYGVGYTTVSHTIHRAYKRCEKALNYVYLGCKIATEEESDWKC